MKPWIFGAFTLMTACQASQPATEQPTLEASADSPSDALKSRRRENQEADSEPHLKDASPDENLPLGFSVEPNEWARFLRFQVKDEDHFDKSGERITRVDWFLREPRFWSVQTSYNDGSTTVELQNLAISFASQATKPVIDASCEQTILLANPLVEVQLPRYAGVPVLVFCKPAL